MDTERLDAACRYLWDTPFPDHPVDDVLHKWMFEHLLETDGFYFGLAQSALSGVVSRRPSEKHLKLAESSLREVHVTSASDQQILEECRGRLAALREIHEALGADGGHA